MVRHHDVLAHRPLREFTPRAAQQLMRHRRIQKRSPLQDADRQEDDCRPIDLYHGSGMGWPLSCGRNGWRVLAFHRHFHYLTFAGVASSALQVPPGLPSAQPAPASFQVLRALLLLEGRACEPALRPAKHLTSTYLLPAASQAPPSKAFGTPFSLAIPLTAPSPPAPGNRAGAPPRWPCRPTPSDPAAGAPGPPAWCRSAGRPGPRRPSASLRRPAPGSWPPP